MILSAPGYLEANEVKEAKLGYVNSLPVDHDLIIDTRNENECQQNSLARAVCIPPSHLIANHNRLANFSGLFWLLGTAGLTGSEHVVVVGNKKSARDFMAGWLYVAGQFRVTVLETAVSELLEQGLDSAPGQSRSTTRKAVYTAQSRTQLLVLKSELQQYLNLANLPIIVDGRTESEYWGYTSNAIRGGHIPGAMHLENPTTFKAQTDEPVIAYTNDSISGLAYLARLIASGIDAKLYLAGWVEWAADGSLPIDAATYPRRRSHAAPATTRSEKPDVIAKEILAQFATPVLMLTGALVLTTFAYYIGRNNRIKA